MNTRGRSVGVCVVLMTMVALGMGGPATVAEDHDAHEFWETVHEPFWWVIAVLVVIHILAAFYNHFVAKNDVLRRMTHGVKKPDA